MAQSPEQIRESAESLSHARFRGRLRARGIARGMVWRNGVVPDGSPSFPDKLSGDLLEYGYGLLALALELRDANRTRVHEARFETVDAFEAGGGGYRVPAVRRGDPADGEHGRHLVVSAAAFHLAGFAARAFSLLPVSVLARNLASPEHALALLLRRDLVGLRELIVSWLSRDEYSDDTIAARLQDQADEFGLDDAVLLAPTNAYFRALGLADTALVTGDPGPLRPSIRGTQGGCLGRSERRTPTNLVGRDTFTTHLLRDLWDQSLHHSASQRPARRSPGAMGRAAARFHHAVRWRRGGPHLDLWPSQLEAARRSIDPTDDLVIALPTSAGKTRIAELCILRAHADRKRVVSVTPLRALSAQVERVLARTFAPLGASVTSLYGAIGASSVDDKTLADADVVVATPEKAGFSRYAKTPMFSIASG